MNVDELVIEINSTGSDVAKAIDKLTKSLSSLKTGNSETAKALNKTKNELSSLEKVANSFSNTISKIANISVLTKIFSMIGTAVSKSNEYVESLNLFTVSLGEYAQEAENYAETVSEALGIDPAEWLKAQGVFQTIVEGFGVVSDRAYTMSKNLTQLSYDISSFYNVDVQESITKLTSAISGELEPLDLVA